MFFWTARGATMHQRLDTRVRRHLRPITHARHVRTGFSAFMITERKPTSVTKPNVPSAVRSTHK